MNVTLTCDISPGSKIYAAFWTLLILWAIKICIVVGRTLTEPHLVNSNTASCRAVVRTDAVGISTILCFGASMAHALSVAGLIGEILASETKSAAIHYFYISALGFTCLCVVGVLLTLSLSVWLSISRAFRHTHISSKERRIAFMITVVLAIIMMAIFVSLGSFRQGGLSWLLLAFALIMCWVIFQATIVVARKCSSQSVHTKMRLATIIQASQRIGISVLVYCAFSVTYASCWFHGRLIVSRYYLRTIIAALRIVLFATGLLVIETVSQTTCSAFRNRSSNRRDSRWSITNNIQPFEQPASFQIGASLGPTEPATTSRLGSRSTCPPTVTFDTV
jgi:hypothetical protein